MVWLTLLGVLAVVVSYMALKRKADGMKATPPLQEGPPVSVQQALAMVDELIAQGDRLFVERAPENIQFPAQLGPITKGFFARYAALQTRRGGFRLAVADIGPSEYTHGYISIGHSEDWDVIQRPGNDEVFVVEGAETREDQMEVRFPSVYHLILDEAQLT
ncbi:hypothetical protein ACQUJS_07015 [Ralstonia pseudosolanacearum]|uniref:Uncharacterized protein n=1 Tax=Ralstonia solanacearum TaxID=305 RepID=A0A0S4U0A3_RALSL|nr:hypothetical protein RSP799_24100 [Ralstonia solanacearum]CUV15693.1 protein of unknown function [Ralstonia solanacearum]